MQFLGLHVFDIIVLLIYLVVILYLGKKAGEGNSDTDEFFLAGRSLGKFYQFFLNFGASTNADQAVAVTRETYRQGVGGMWIQFLVLFLTPFYWFTALFFRRVRLTTLGDYFTERFKSPFLGGSYAVFTLLMAFVGGGVGYMVAGKTMMAITPKPAEMLTVEQRTTVEEFNEYHELDALTISERTEVQQARYDVLQQKNLRGELRSFYSYTDPLVFYFAYGLIVAVYTMMGGFRAAAITDVIQGFLIVLFSMILIPLGLSKLGGFEGLHAAVPAFKFELFGSVSLSEYGWYTIFAMACSNLVAIVAIAQNMQTAGSATNENSARFGIIGGMFFKRLLMLSWILAGLIAVGLYAGKLHDPDLAWGYMSRDLLVPGAIGLMLVGILAANMSTLDALSVSNSALFIKNLYQPFRPGKTEKHYITVGRAVIGVTLFGGIGAAVYVDNLLELFKYFISIPAIFGAPIWLGFIWRRLTKTAVMVEVVVCFAIFAILPNVFMSLDWARTNPAFLQQTDSFSHMYKAPALSEDVALGRAENVGDSIEKEIFIESKGIFFEKVARQNPEDPNSPLIGIGRFESELWVMSWFGVDFTGFKKSQLVAARFFFNAFFPFVILILVSLLTQPVSKRRLDYFFAKIYTPVQATPEADKLAVAHAAANPTEREAKKIFPKSSWEIAKPDRMDIIGFGGSWVAVGVVILLLWAMVSIH
ncbi:sodium:solute symporter family protein [Pelagicoccus sp. SDUM812002]|uniref:sodium:solute symporter family protein n=1 Tax=Pelagicoccus sp. SDUM812002 TaxID=3041266 RepID=UPI00280D84AD|nr:sodium:solute symporter family protein [Pelagicoccus sp. SDUM812002]MDQ8187696.1 sodium:solute symporter family protein [Pelagicoccus sp. SDUM812002]